MKMQIVLDRSTSDFQAIATLMAQTTSGFVPVASTPLYDNNFAVVVAGWQALAGLLATMVPQPADAAIKMLARYQVVSGAPAQTVVWTGGG